MITRHRLGARAKAATRRLAVGAGDHTVGDVEPPKERLDLGEVGQVALAAEDDRDLRFLHLILHVVMCVVEAGTAGAVRLPVADVLAVVHPVEADLADGAVAAVDRVLDRRAAGGHPQHTAAGGDDAAVARAVPA
jgi:hypothetical protein